MSLLGHCKYWTEAGRRRETAPDFSTCDGEASVGTSVWFYSQSRNHLEEDLMRFTRFSPRRVAARGIATFFCTVMFLFAARGTSQLAGTGSIQGIITDNTGAVIQNASVTVTNTATQIHRVGNTENNGLYR